MKKFNLMLGMVIGILALSVVSASLFTGYTVKRGEFIGNLKVTSVNAAQKTVTIGDSSYKEGDIVKIDGKTLMVKDISRKNILTRPKAEFVPIDSKINFNKRVALSAKDSSAEIKCPSYLNGETFVVDGHDVILNINPDGSFYFDVGDETIPLPSFALGYNGIFELYGMNIKIQDSGLDHVSICVEEIPTSRHTHVSDPYSEDVVFTIPSDTDQAALASEGTAVPLSSSGQGMGTIKIYGNNWYDEDSGQWKTTKIKQWDLKVVCNKFNKYDLALGGSYVLGLNYADGLEYYVTGEGVYNDPQVGASPVGEYHLSIIEPFTDVNQDFVDDEGIGKIEMTVTCARVEPTQHAFGEDY